MACLWANVCASGRYLFSVTYSLMFSGPKNLGTDFITLHWCHNERDGISNHQPQDCLVNHLFWCRSKKTSKLRVTGLCVGNSLGTSEFPAQMASNTEIVSIWWHHHNEVEIHNEEGLLSCTPVFINVAIMFNKQASLSQKLVHTLGQVLGIPNSSLFFFFSKYTLVTLQNEIECNRHIQGCLWRWGVGCLTWVEILTCILHCHRYAISVG